MSQRRRKKHLGYKFQGENFFGQKLFLLLCDKQKCWCFFKLATTRVLITTIWLLSHTYVETTGVLITTIWILSHIYIYVCGDNRGLVYHHKDAFVCIRVHACI